MISPSYARTMARYNRWQNLSIYAAADMLTDAQRRAQCGIFFGSIHATLNHLLWADEMWLHRLAGRPAPAASGIAGSTTQRSDWEGLRRDRAGFDEVIASWADGLEQAWFDGELTWYSGVAGREITRPRALIVVHLFNHQTHHRGQVHAALTGFGAKPEATDLPFMPDQVGAS